MAESPNSAPESAAASSPLSARPPPQPPHQGLRLLRKLLLYHLTVALVLAGLLALLPRLPDHLPIGGVRDLARVADVRVGGVEDVEPAFELEAEARARESTPDLDRLGYARQLAIALVGIWVLMLPVSWVHKGIYRGNAHDHSLDETTLILPGVVAAIVMVVQYSLALAFALAGIVAGVQFRRALQDTFDALFILLAIGTGIAAGVGALEVAAVITVFFCYAAVYLCVFGDGLESDFIAARKERKQQIKAERVERATDDDDD
jgi:hypothetical protein